MKASSKKKTTPQKGAKSAKAAIRKNERTLALKADLFDRVVSILEQARAGAARAINSQMVLAYWLIGREIVQEIQGGEDRAEYGETVIQKLSSSLGQRYGRGFSTSNLKYFRQFYQTYADRMATIGHIESGQFEVRREFQIGHKPCGQSQSAPIRQKAREVLADLVSAVESEGNTEGFSPNLSWSHYRTLLGVENRSERRFYEIEAEKERWSVPHLQRQIHTCLFARLLKSKDKEGVLALATKGQEVLRPVDAIKHPYVLDFLGLPESEALHESAIESAIIGKLQPFLLEIGKGFAFVDRQHRIATETQHFYIDLVFYNYLLKCFVLIDLKIRKLTHQDIGQMDMYVRMFDDLRKGDEDNPTVGLILCAEKDEVVVKYSMLEGSKQLFASKYMLYLPSEEELRREIERERSVIDNRAESSPGKISRQKAD